MHSIQQVEHFGQADMAAIEHFAAVRVVAVDQCEKLDSVDTDIGIAMRCTYAGATLDPPLWIMISIVNSLSLSLSRLLFCFCKNKKRHHHHTTSVHPLPFFKK